MKRFEETADDDYRLEDQVGFVLRKAHQRASEIFLDVMSEFDVTPTQFSVLIRLEELGPCSQNFLGRQAAMDPATILGVVARLKKRGLVTQAPDRLDRRQVLVSLTGEGRALAARLRARGAEVSRRILAPLEEGERTWLLGALERIDART